MELSKVKTEVTPETPTGMVRLTVPDPQFAATPPFQ
jgi:hypothetical protein